MAAEWSSSFFASVASFTFSDEWARQRAGCFHRSERSFIQCSQLVGGALIVINVGFLSFPQPQILRRWRPWKKDTKALMNKVWSLSCFNWFITLPLKAPHFWGWCDTFFCHFPMMHCGTYAFFYHGSPAAATVMTSSNRATSNSQPPDNPASSTAHEGLFWPGCSEIHNTPYTDQQHHYFNIILQQGQVRVQTLKSHLKKIMLGETSVVKDRAVRASAMQCVSCLNHI